MEIYCRKIRLGKYETHKIRETKTLFQKYPKQLVTCPREMILEIRKKTKTIWNISLRKILQKNQKVLNPVGPDIGYVHNLSNLNEIMNISDFNEDQKLSYLS